MYRDQFKTNMKVFFVETNVTVKVRNNGWGEVFTSDGYVGSIAPIRVIQLRKLF